MQALGVGEHCEPTQAARVWGNRAAQRRFRERQKSLISALKEREEALAKQCQEQKQLIDALQRENEILKEVVNSGKGK